MTKNALSSILVATDFSEAASWAVARAFLLRLAPAAKLLVLHVIPDSLRTDLRRPAEVKAHDDLQKAAAYAAQAASVPGTSDVAVETAVLVGKPSAEIVRCARQMDAELVVLGRQGHRSMRDLFSRSTVRQVTRNGDVPVLVVSSKPIQPYRRPSVALDLEDSSLRTVEIVAQLLGTGVKVIPVVYACRLPFEGWIRQSITQARLNWYRQDFREQASAQFSKLSRSYGDHPARLKPIVREGRAIPVILTEAARRRSDLLALGTHRHSGIWRALTGGTVEGVLSAARCDVLIAPFAPSSSVPDRPAAANMRV